MMLTQCLRVLGTYLTRPACWVLAAIAMLAWGSGFSMLSGGPAVYPVFPVEMGEFEGLNWNLGHSNVQYPSRDSFVDRSFNRSLRVEGGGPDSHLPSSETFPDLRQIHFDDWPVSCWRELAQFPNLETIVIRNVDPDVFDRSVIDMLRQLPSLRFLYVAQRKQGDPFAGFERIQLELPRVKVRPSQAQVYRFITMASALVGLFIWTLLMIAQVSTHYLPPFARLMPNFMTIHLAIDAVAWIAGLLISSYLIAAVGNHWLSSMALAQFLQFPFTSGLCLSVSRPNSHSRWTSSWMLHATWMSFTATIIVSPALFVFGVLRVSDVDWFLRGNNPIWMTVILIAAVLFLAEAIVRLVRLHTSWQESGRTIPALGLNFKTHEKQSGVRGDLAANWSLAGWLASSQERRLDRLATKPFSKEAPPRSLWIRGNIVCGWDGLKLAAGLSLIVCGFPLAELLFSGSVSRQYREILVLVAVLAGGLASMMSSGNWLARRSTLVSESLRPLSRNNFIRKIWFALLLDMLPCLSWQVMTSVLGIWLLSPSNPLAYLATAFACAALLGSWFVFYGGMLLLLTFRENLGSIIATVTLMVLMFFTQISIAGMAIADFNHLNGGDLAAVTWSFWAIGLILTALSWWRWHRLEFGKL